MAINKDEIIEGVLLGLGKEATGPYKPGTWVYNPNVETYPYDPEEGEGASGGCRMEGYRW